MSPTCASEHLLRESTPTLLDDTGSSFSRESSPPATSIFAVSRAPSIYLGDDSKHISIGDRTRVGGVEPDAVDPSLEHVSRPLKWKRCADISTDDVRAKKARTSGTWSDESIADDSTSLGLGHILVRECTSIRVAELDDVHAFSPHIDVHAPLAAIARPPKRRRCANTSSDEVRATRRRLSDSPSDASKIKDGVPFGPHPRCMITGCVSADVGACYVLPPEMPQLLIYKYCVIAEDEHLPDSCMTMGHPTTPSFMTAPCSYSSFGWHELKANIRLMILRADQKLSNSPSLTLSPQPPAAPSSF
ncbi:predicted protein [Postia placenta Mad-698-R]|nr:predicted protein [Postia placenta Mad-698-R]